MTRRTTWSNHETKYLLMLIKEQKNMGMLDGKRLRVSEIFKSLEKPMANAGLDKDASSMKIKFKNLKGDYYRCMRASKIGEPDFQPCPFFDELHDLFSYRLPGIFGIFGNDNIKESNSLLIDNSDDHENSTNDKSIDVLVPTVVLRTQPDPEAEPQPSCSASPVEESPLITIPEKPETGNKSGKSSIQKNMTELIKVQKEIRNKVFDYLDKQNKLEDKYLDKFLKAQQESMLLCTSLYLKGIKNILKRKRDDDTDSDEEF